MADMPPLLDIEQTGRRLRDGALTCVELTRRCLAAIEREQPRLNAFITVTADLVLDEAMARDAELKAGRDRGPLHGVPVVFKDCLDTAGVRTTVGTQCFSDRMPEEDAVVVARLRAAGAVMLGKTNMDELAAGTSGRNVHFGNIRNPLALEYSPGGSSSGTAAAVAAGLAMVGVGTDGGGSIRVPAACCGIVGLRATLGRIPKRGAFPRSFSFDVVGPLARTVRDCAILYQAMAGHDPADRSSLELDVGDVLGGMDRGAAGLRIGVIEDFSFKGVDDEIAIAVKRGLDRFRDRGAAVRSVSIPAFSAGFEYGAIFDIMLYEFNQIMGGRFRSFPNPKKMFGPWVCANIERGEKITEAEYNRAIESKTAQAGEIRSVFKDVDILVTPVLSALPPRLDAPDSLFERQRQFMIPFSFAGVPALSVPCGRAAKGMPIGMQLVGDHGREADLFRLASVLD